MKNLFFLTLILSVSTCAVYGKTLDRAQHDQIIKRLKTPEAPGMVKLVTDEKHEVPDPTRPLLLEMPNGQKKYVIGFSGQNILLLDNLQSLVMGGPKSTSKVDLTNTYGFNYGGEIDPQTGKPIEYVYDSSTWDVAIFRYTTLEGRTALKVVAGAMGTGSDGKPLMIKDGHNNTRQRLFFEAEFDHNLKLHASMPKAILNSTTPKNGNWIEYNEKGEVTFSHGYGGEPVTLANGDLYIDERGLVPFVYETVVEQRDRIPYRTAICVAYLDKTLSKVVIPKKIIFDVFKPDGSIWKAAQRPTAGPLVEGPHIEVRANGKPVQSLSELKQLRSANAQIDYQMLFGAGEYFGMYGSYMATSKMNLENFKPALDNRGELLDITAPLRVLFTWIGRPVSFQVDGKEYLLIHGVDRNSLPRGFTLDQAPRENEWPYFKRQEIVVPVERRLNNGVPELQMRDDSGLIEFLKQYEPRKVSSLRSHPFKIGA